MFSGINMNRLIAGGSKAIGGSKKTTGGGKRKAEVSPKKMELSLKKRSALGDLTNAAKKKGSVSNKDKDKPVDKAVKLEAKVPMTRARSKNTAILEEPEPVNRVKKDPIVSKHSELGVLKSKQVVNELKGKEEEKVQHVQASKLPVRQTRSSRTRTENTIADKENDTENQGEEMKVIPRTRMSTRSSTAKAQPLNSTSLSETSQESPEDDNSILYTTAISSPESSSGVFNVDVEEQNRINENLSQEPRSKLPDGVIDFDAESGNDPFQVGIYAEDIFAYYSRRELRFHIFKYLDTQTELNSNMRAILVDWMVEVQESFELNHETMYLAVKLVDLYLSKVQVKREKLQLVGTTALYIAAKFDERSPPGIDDFCYICDDAYPQRDVIRMEMKMLRTLDFDIGVPLSYRFLRRYSRCAKLDMETLTQARYVLEMSLMEYDFIDVRDSMMAASALLLALTMKGVQHPWSKTLEYYSGYNVSDLVDLTHRMHHFLSDIPSHLKTIHTKYSHKVFYEAAKVPLPDLSHL